MTFKDETQPMYCHLCTRIVKGTKGLSLHLQHWCPIAKSLNNNVTNYNDKTYDQIILDFQHKAVLNGVSNVDSEALDNVSIGSVEEELLPPEDEFDNLVEDNNDEEPQAAEEAEPVGWLQNHNDFVQTQVHELNEDPRYIVELNLLHLLKKHGSSVSMFDDIMSWAHESVLVHKHSFVERPRKRAKIVSNLLEQSNLKGMLPQEKELELISKPERFVSVTVHPIRHAIYSLLSDPRLNQDGNYIFANNADPFLVPQEEPQDITDIHHGRSYYDAYHRYVQNPKHDMVCGIGIYIDKTHVSANGNQTLEPVSICLCIHNKATWLQQFAWRSVGYIINQSHHKHTKDAQKKLCDYHASLHLILEQLSAIQKEGMDWEFHFKDQKYSCKLHFPILFIQGDTEALDKLCCKMVSRSAVSHLCRMCNAPLHESGNPDFQFSLHKEKSFQRMRAYGQINRINTKAHHFVDPYVFDILDFGHNV